MKKIYWIDDNINYISYYIQGIIKELWGDENTDGISSVIRVFGDAYKQVETEKDWSDDSLNNLKEEIQNNMSNHCLDLEAWNWGIDDEIYKKKEFLISDPPILIKRNTDAVEKFLNKWKLKECENWENWDDAELSIENIRTCFQIPEGASVAIDLVLLFGDKEKIENNNAIISMLLYAKLSDAGHQCILYSSYMYDSIFIDKWKQIYNQKKSETLPNVDIIYPGRDMWEKAQKNELIEKIKKIAQNIDL